MSSLLNEVVPPIGEEKSYFDQSTENSNDNSEKNRDNDYDIIDEKKEEFGTNEEGFKTDDSEVEDDLLTSSFKNIIPLEKIKNGWFNISTLVKQNSLKVQEKIIETYNSESVKSFKQNTVEMVSPVWEKTCETAGPVWEQTKANASLVAENIKPTLDSVTEFTVNGATAAMNTISESYKHFAQSFNNEPSESKTNDSTPNNLNDGTPSVMDQATRGGPMVV